MSRTIGELGAAWAEPVLGSKLTAGDGAEDPGPAGGAAGSWTAVTSLAPAAGFDAGDVDPPQPLRLTATAAAPMIG
ncbi:MAG TPA: hypothetical protein VGC79_00585 [Polyangiaceae bacterium]